jgi:anaphase-promoting complex subunit 1
MLESFPDAVIAVLKHAIAQCQATPPTTWTSALLDLINREDLTLLASGRQPRPQELVLKQVSSHTSRKVAMLTWFEAISVRDAHTICQATETPALPINLPEYTDRIWISRLIFNKDKRLVEAMHLVEPLRTAVAICPHDPSWSEQQMLDAQKDVIQWVMTRTFALAPGNGMAHFDSRNPLLTEKYAIHGYSMLCKMQPMGNTVSADRSTLSEDKYGWSWFHAGVAAGLSISRHAQGIDTSWIIFNRPPELTNRHAGLLLALGLNGHLKNVARWLCFKYLTPKHTMTSIGLLLGLSASRLGTMDTLVTRLLSVHITRMLPPGAAELNLSPLTQTAGLMGIGLLYCGTQHRRMSEVMLSEIENIDVVDPADTLVHVRDESYRLAAGFALGYINLGKGNDIRGLNDMRVTERLLAVAVGPRPVELVHILDQATAAATVAIALIFMKTGNKTVARKVDVPDTLPQFDYVRPDVLLLRTLAKHLILWDEISAEDEWIVRNLPTEYRSFHNMRDIQTLKSEHMSFYYILAGLLWSIGLRHAGSGNKTVCTFLVSYLDRFIRVCKLPAHRYDAKLTRTTIRNCQDLVALSCATTMAGTGDLDVMRRLRVLHGRTNADTPYGSHLAAHMALGALFLGAGTFTFGTSNLAIASLICAFYPLFPVDVTDNKAHLQPFRHLWALAAEARCIITREVDTNRPIRVPLILKLHDGTTKSLTAPCLLPELHTIARVETSGTEYWPMTVDFEHNPAHLASFKKHQTLYVRKRPSGSANRNTFSATFLSLNDAQTTTLVGARKLFRSIFELPFFKEGSFSFGLEDIGLILPGDERSSIWKDARGSVVDTKLVLRKIAKEGLDRNGLWNLRVLFKWAETMDEEGHAGVGWLGQEVIKDLRGIVDERSRRLLREADT